IERGRMLRLIETDLASAGQLDGCPNAPAFFGNLSTAHIPGLQLFDLSGEIVAHQVKMGSQHSVPLVKRFAVAFVDRMYGRFRARQLEDQPAAANVNVGISQHIAKEVAIEFRLFAVEQDVSAENHGGSLYLLLQLI